MDSIAVRFSFDLLESMICVGEQRTRDLSTSQLRLLRLLRNVLQSSDMTMRMNGRHFPGAVEAHLLSLPRSFEIAFTNPYMLERDPVGVSAFFICGKDTERLAPELHQWLAAHLGRTIWVSFEPAVELAEVAS